MLRTADVPAPESFLKRRFRAAGALPATGDRGFESVSLHRGVSCEPDREGFLVSVCRARAPSHEWVLRSGLHDATATDAKGRNTRHRAGDNPAGCRLAKFIANLGIRRPTPHYSYSDYAGGSPRHCPLCAAGRDSGSRWAGVAARSRPGRSCRSGCAHWREDLFQPMAPSISEIMPSSAIGPERRL
jgi:hypothetical protein